MPYLASALFAPTVTAQPDCATIAVDRTWHVHADPALVDALEVAELGRLFVHLIGHLLRDHADRASVLRVEQDNERERWNRAGDAEINDDLEDVGCVPGVAPDRPVDLDCENGQLAETY